MKNTQTKATCEVDGPRLPNGQEVGNYIEEDGLSIWERNVKRKHILRFLDAWTINELIVRQLVADCVDEIRYKTCEGIYVVSLEDFLEQATLLRAFACDEDVYALPRNQWHFEEGSGSGQLLLFMKRDEE